MTFQVEGRKSVCRCFSDISFGNPVRNVLAKQYYPCQSTHLTLRLRCSQSGLCYRSWRDRLWRVYIRAGLITGIRRSRYVTHCSAQSQWSTGTGETATCKAGSTVVAYFYLPPLCDPRTVQPWQLRVARQGDSILVVQLLLLEMLQCRQRRRPIVFFS